MKSCLMGLLFWMCSIPAAHAHETIIWFRSDSPPISIVNGPDKNRGSGDVWGNYLMTRMPEFQHEVMTANFVRIFEESKHRDNACDWLLFKTPEREKNLLFSEPLLDVLPSGLVVLASRRAEFAPYLNEKGELRLTNLLAAHKFRIGAATQRSFGPMVDTLLLQSYARSSVSWFAAYDVFSSGLARMANHQTLDGVLGFAVELSFATEHVGRREEDFVFFPLVEESALTPGYVACSKSPFGEKVIARVNDIIRFGGGELALRAYRAWLPAQMRNYYDAQRKGRSRTRSTALSMR